MAIKVLFVIKENELEELVNTDISLENIVMLAEKRILMSGENSLYKPKDILAVNLTDNSIEIECEVI